MRNTIRDDSRLEQEITELLNDPEYEGHPLREALSSLYQSYQDELARLERLTSISDGFQTVLRARNETMAERYRRQIRQLYKIVRISDHYQKMLQELNEALRVASTQDPLTGLYNRRLMLDRLKSEASLSGRQQLPFSLALIDVDHFKSINDEFGHDVGDQALICLARAFIGGFRGYDVCARWGGEEFLVLLPETLGSEALNMANRVRLAINALQCQELPPGIRFSISIGVAEHTPESDFGETIRRADLALYKAKDAGRNRIVLAP